MNTRETQQLSIDAHVAQIEHLVEMQEQINDKLTHTINSLITLKLVENINCYIINSVTKDEMMYIVIGGVHTRKFQCGEKTNDKFDNWHGEHKFSYGDIMFDKKSNEYCTVIYETCQYVTFWYFEEKNCPGTTRRRMKYDSNLLMVKRMILY